MSFQNTFSNFRKKLDANSHTHTHKSFERNRTFKYSSCKIIVLWIVQIQTNGSHLSLIGWIDGSEFGQSFASIRLCEFFRVLNSVSIVVSQNDSCSSEHVPFWNVDPRPSSEVQSRFFLFFFFFFLFATRI